MISRTILSVALAGSILVCAGMMVGCKKKEEPKPSIPTMSEEVERKVTETAEAAKETAEKAAERAGKAVEETKEAVAAAMTENTICPVMEAPIDKSIFVEYKGKKVYFCCPQCKGDFEKAPEKYVGKLPQFK